MHHKSCSSSLSLSQTHCLSFLLSVCMYQMQCLPQLRIGISWLTHKKIFFFSCVSHSFSSCLSPSLSPSLSLSLSLPLSLPLSLSLSLSLTPSVANHRLLGKIVCCVHDLYNPKIGNRTSEKSVREHYYRVAGPPRMSSIRFRLNKINCLVPLLLQSKSISNFPRQIE